MLKCASKRSAVAHLEGSGRNGGQELDEAMDQDGGKNQDGRKLEMKIFRFGALSLAAGSS